MGRQRKLTNGCFRYNTTSIIIYNMKEILVRLEENMRLDRYLRTIDSALSQGVIEKALRRGDIKVDGFKVTANFRVKNGSVISINKYFHINGNQGNEEEFDTSTIVLANKLISEYLIYEDENFIAINKPAKLPTQGGKNIKISIDHALSYLNSNGYNLRLVHRLDRDTSGILLIAKTRTAANRLTRAFEHHRIEKQYLAITYGNLKLDSYGQIKSYLLKIGDKITDVSEETQDAKLAISSYELLSSSPMFNLIGFYPKTGRMHQIRAHCAYNLQTPIVGDTKYGSLYESDNLLLHAYKILVHKEIFQKEILISLDPPEYFFKYIKEHGLKLSRSMQS